MFELFEHGADDDLVSGRILGHQDPEVAGDDGYLWGCCGADLARRRDLELELEPERRAMTRRRTNTDAASHQVHNALADRKTQSGSALAARDMIVAALEGKEQAALHFGTDTDAGIRHREAHAGTSRVPFDDLDGEDDRALFRVLHGIAQEIEEQLAQLPGIASQEFGNCRFHRRGDREARSTRYALGDLHGTLGELADVEGALLGVEMPCLEPRKIQDVVDDGEQMGGGVLDDPHGALLLGVQGGLGQKARHADHGVHRRPNLVAHHRQEFRLRVGGLLGIPACAPKVDDGGLLPGQEGGNPARQAEQQEHHQGRAAPDEGGCRSPQRQDQAVGRRYVDDERIVLERSRRHDAHLRHAVGQPRRLGHHGSGGIAAGNDIAEHRLIDERPAHQVLALGIAGEQDAVRAEQRDRTILADVHGLEEFLEEAAVQTGQHQAERCPGTALDLARQIERPCAGAAVADRGAQEDVEGGVRHMGDEIVAIRQVDRRRREASREVDHLPVRADDGRHIDLRDAARFVAQNVEDLARAECLSQVGIGLDTRLLHAIDDGLEHEIGRLHRLSAVFGQHDRAVVEVGLPLRDLGLARVPEHQC